VTEAELERDLERYRREYRGKLPGKLAELGELLRGAREARGKADLEAARRMAHTLMGTSGSYGFDEFSAELRRIEEGLDLLSQELPPDAAAAWDRIGQALARARDCLGLPGQAPASRGA
jgi:chemotaxis protein histidine kinase CheA